MAPSLTNELLGYPADARLLILNADDFGMYSAINEATIRTLTEGVVRSTTLMAPCDGAAQALDLLRQHPEIAFGVHLTAISDLISGQYAPLTPSDKLPSIVDETGKFYTLERQPEFLARARVDELEVEFRAQIETVLAANLRPAHLDWHCLHSGGRADIFAMTLGLARDYGLAVRVAEHPQIAAVQARGLPTADHALLDSFDVDPAVKTSRYTELLRNLPAGLSEWAVHPGSGSPEAQALDDGWQVRQTDFEFLVSAQARDLIASEGIIVLNYRPLQALWAGRKADNVRAKPPPPEHLATVVFD